MKNRRLLTLLFALHALLFTACTGIPAPAAPGNALILQQYNPAGTATKNAILPVLTGTDAVLMLTGTGAPALTGLDPNYLFIASNTLLRTTNATQLFTTQRGAAKSITRTGAGEADYGLDITGHTINISGSAAVNIISGTRPGVTISGTAGQLALLSDIDAALASTGGISGGFPLTGAGVAIDNPGNNLIRVLGVGSSPILDITALNTYLKAPTAAAAAGTYMRVSAAGNAIMRATGNATIASGTPVDITTPGGDEATQRLKVADPIDNNDAVTKGYADAHYGGTGAGGNFPIIGAGVVVVNSGAEKMTLGVWDGESFSSYIDFNGFNLDIQSDNLRLMSASDYIEIPRNLKVSGPYGEVSFIDNGMSYAPVNVAAPWSAQHAATKAYVDDVAAGVKWQRLNGEEYVSSSATPLPGKYIIQRYADAPCVLDGSLLTEGCELWFRSENVFNNGDITLAFAPGMNDGSVTNSTVYYNRVVIPNQCTVGFAFFGGRLLMISKTGNITFYTPAP